MKNSMQKNSMKNLMNIETLIKKKTDFINKKLNMLAIHGQLSKLDLTKIQMDFDATSLCPSAMWHINSRYPKIETGFVFKPHMIDFYVEAFNNQTFEKDGKESVILKIEYYNPPNLIFNIYRLQRK